MSLRTILAQIQTIWNDVEESTLTVQERLKDHYHVLREPHPLRRSQLRDTIIQGRSDVQSQLDGLKIVEDKLFGLRGLLEKQHALYISQNSPIHALPPEILARIFDWTNHDDGSLGTSYRSTLMRVSKSWNHFVQCQPSLWTVQQVSAQDNPTLDLSIVRERFARSGALPLRLQIFFKNHHPSTVLQGSSPDLDASWLTRVNKLHIIAHRELCFDVINGFRSLVRRGQLPSLQELDVIARDPPHTCDPCKRFGTERVTMVNEENPVLSTLFLNGDIVDLSTILLSGLRSLTLISVDNVPWSTLKNMLSRSIMIEDLRLHDLRLWDTRFQDDDDSPISLPCLRDLYIEDDCASAPFRFIRALHAPLLKKFTFKVDLFDGEHLKDFLIGEAETLSSLASHLRNLLLTSTGLEELVFQAPPETMVLLVHTLPPYTPANGEAPTILPAPKLHSLELSFCPNIYDHTYEDLQLTILANVIRSVHDARADWMHAGKQGTGQGSTGLQSIRVPSCLFSCCLALAGLEASSQSYLCNCPNR